MFTVTRETNTGRTVYYSLAVPRPLCGVPCRQCSVATVTLPPRPATPLKVLPIFFSKEIDDILLATYGLASPPVISQESSSLSSFQPSTEAAVRRIIMTSPTKSCSLYPVPTFLIREYIDLLLPFVTRMVNASLVQGRLPASQRHAKL